MYLFADDTKLMKRVRSRKDNILRYSNMDGIQKWLLNFYPDKRHVLTLGKLRNIRHAYNYHLGDTELEHVFSEIDLGVVIDTNLSFEDHIAEKIRKANSIVGLIYRSFNYLLVQNYSNNYMQRLYAQFRNMHKLYYFQSYVSNNIENIQRRATRLIHGYKNLLTHSYRLVSLNLLSIPEYVNGMV